jgi:hypothetical protein
MMKDEKRDCNRLKKLNKNTITMVENKKKIQ